MIEKLKYLLTAQFCIDCDQKIPFSFKWKRRNDEEYRERCEHDNNCYAWAMKH